MFFVSIILLLLVSAALYWRRKTRAATAFIAVATVLLMAVGSGPLTGILLRNLQAGYETADSTSVRWQPNSLIILLGMGTVTLPSGKNEVGPLAYGRIAEALEAYHLCRSTTPHCRVLVTGGDKYRKGVIEAQVYAEQLRRMGVPSTDLLLETKSQNTWENALYSRQVVDRIHPDAIYLITSGVHMRRALLYFRHFGMSPTPIRSDYLLPWDTIEPMAFNITLADLALTEYQGLLRYKLYNRLGKNPPPSKPYVPRLR